MTIGELLKQARLDAGMSMTQLEKESGVPKQLISRYEKNENRPLPRNIGALAFALGLSAEDIAACSPGQQCNNISELKLELTRDMARLLFLYSSIDEDEQTKVLDFMETLAQPDNKR